MIASLGKGEDVAAIANYRAIRKSEISPRLKSSANEYGENTWNFDWLDSDKTEEAWKEDEHGRASRPTRAIRESAAIPPLPSQLQRGN